MDLILKQVKENCPCFNNADGNDKEIKAMIKQLLSLLSVTLCWNGSLCDTLIYGSRREEFDYLPNGDECLKCKPCSSYKKFPLFYQTKDSKLEITSVTVNTYLGLDSEEIILDEDSYAVRNGVLIIDGSKLPNNCCTCSCEEYSVVVEYESGFEKLPECLINIFCQLLTSMSLSFMGCGSVQVCCEMKTPKAYQILTSKKIGDISYTWTVDKSNVQYIYNQMLTHSMFSLISTMSLCGKQLEEERLWFVSSCY